MTTTTETQQSISLFLKGFNQLKEDIESELAKFENNTEQKQRHLENCIQIFGDLKKCLSDHLLMLPTYEIAQAQKVVDILDSKISNAATSAKSKKKFSFKSKKTSTSSIESTENNNVQEKQVSEPTGLNVIDDSYSLVGLQRSDIFLCDIMKALRISDLSDCNVYCGAVQGSILILNCHRCKFMLAAQQIRIHTSSQCDFYVSVRSKPIIEQCSKVRFAPYLFSFPTKEQHWQCMNFKDAHDNLWSQVEDFDWLKSSQSPNWTMIPEDERESMTVSHMPSEKIQLRT